MYSGDVGAFTRIQSGLRGDGLSGFLAYLDAEPDTLIDGNGNGLPDTQVISNAPELTGSIRANFDWPLFGGLLTASAGYAYRDDAVLTNEEFPITQDAYGLLDAWIMWLSGNAKWRFGVSGKNLTDEEYLLTGYTISSLGILQGSYGPPRQLLLAPAVMGADQSFRSFPQSHDLTSSFCQTAGSAVQAKASTVTASPSSIPARLPTTRATRSSQSTKIGTAPSTIV